MPTRITELPQRLETPPQLSRWSLRCRAAGMAVGLVPTMGALHPGHLSLIERALAECDRVVVSIFVNPLQFGAGEDFERYPRPVEQDLAMLRDLRVHAVFTPSTADMYPEPSIVRVRIEGDLGSALEAEHRPGHFDGVALVVTKLLAGARPDRAYFGRKDAQQLLVVRALARQLHLSVDIVGCPVIRDWDGLAWSSRNAYLCDAERARARAIPQGLAAAARRFEAGERDAAALSSTVRKHLAEVDARVDYVAVVESDSVAPVSQAGPGCQILVAAKIGGSRLIDSLRLGLDDPPVMRAPD